MTSEQATEAIYESFRACATAVIRGVVNGEEEFASLVASREDIGAQLMISPEAYLPLLETH